MDSNEIQAIYRDEFGVEAVTLRRREDMFDLVIRGIEFTISANFDSFEPVHKADSGSERFKWDADGFVRGCRLTVYVPLSVTGGVSAELILYSEIPDEMDGNDSAKLYLELWIDGKFIASESDWRVEDGGLRLFKKFAPEVRPGCCLTCAFSDYPPGYSDPFYCFRDVGAEYVQVRGGLEMMKFRKTHPETEIVHELHVCDQFQPRIPGTGYRG
jgi:hypothetical protein